jgi:hypothetical protein
MSNNFIRDTEICFNPSISGKMDPSFFPVGSAQHLDLNYNILPFLCDLLKVANDPSVGPNLTEPPQPFDITPYTDFSALNNVGDPRVSLGETMTQTYINFLPRVITQTEVRQAGGVQVIDNYICTADGTPIKVSETIPAILSLDLTGANPYQYGAITVPPISSTYEDLMKIIEPSEVTNFVIDYVNIRKSDHAKEFVAFIKNYFANSEVLSVNIFDLTKFTIVELKTDNKTTYIKYFYDVAHEIAYRLNKNRIKQYYGNIPTPDNLAQALAFGSSIPNYESFKTDTNSAEQFYQKILKEYTSTPDQNYSSMFSTLSSQVSATPTMQYYIDYFQEYQNNNQSQVREIPVVYQES